MNKPVFAEKYRYRTVYIRNDLVGIEFLQVFLPYLVQSVRYERFSVPVIRDKAVCACGNTDSPISNEIIGGIVEKTCVFCIVGVVLRENDRLAVPDRYDSRG